MKTGYSDYTDREILELLNGEGYRMDGLIQEVAKRFRVTLNTISLMETRNRDLEDKLDGAMDKTADRHTLLSP